VAIPSLAEALPKWRDTDRAILSDALSKTPGRIAADTVRKLSEGRTVEELMLETLPVARLYSRPPLSNFRVGAVALGATGALYLGANIEVPGNGLNQAVHGEQSAVANAFSYDERGISAIAVTAAPCGHCRQFLNEIVNGSKIRVVVIGQEPQTLAQLLPASFGPEDLGIKAGLMASGEHKLRLISGATDALATAALKAASRAYAPHTKALSGCAVRTESGTIFAGSYLENAAFNPSLAPLQMALNSAMFAGEPFASVTRVALVELRGAPISQRDASEAALKTLAPKARVDVFACETIS
jgi:cytidine deaminase